MKPFVLADDLSGALEAGATFLAAGWSVTVPLGSGAPKAGSDGELIVLSSETRNAAPEDAARRVAELLRSPAAQEGELLFKKIDSTLRGPIGAELKALQAAFPGRRIFLCPANPFTGRTVSAGVLHVQGVPLHLTEFRGDPLAPVTTGDIVQLLRDQGVHAVREAGMSDAAVRVCDAEDLDGLRGTVARARAEKPAALLVGSGALGPILAREFAREDSPAREIVRCDTALVLCGSRHSQSSLQLQHLAAEPNSCVIDAKLSFRPAEVAELLATARSSAKVIGVRIDGENRADAATVLPDWMAQLAQHVVARDLFPLLFLTGGETAAAVCRALDGERLHILAELEPGVVFCRLVRSGGRSLHVVIKPGGYGSDDLWARTSARLVK